MSATTLPTGSYGWNVFTGEHRRTFVRYGESKGVDDPRPPRVIEHVAFELQELAWEVWDLAMMELGGLERFTKFYDEEIKPLLALREKPSDA
jgi:hypothetical protein